MTTVVLYLLPEIVLIAAAVAIYMSGAFSAKRGTGPLLPWIAGGALALAAVVLWNQSVGWVKQSADPPAVEAGAADGSGGAALRLTHPTPAAEPESLHSDPLARLTRWLALGLGALLLSLSAHPRPGKAAKGTEEIAGGEATLPRPSSRQSPPSPSLSDGTAERVGSLLLTIAGLMLVAVAGDLVLLFVALELISIPTYILLYIGRRDEASQESATKYFFLNVLASAILLYGLSFLYGLAGSTDLAAIRAALDGAKPPPALSALSQLAMAMIFGGLCFKIAAVPFHFYAPDVYQGTTHPNAALLSVVPKAAGFVVMVRIFVAAMPGMGPHSWLIVLAAAALTMTFGNVLALWQDNLRRLLAYSSIAQAGYMLIALAVGLAAGNDSTAWNGTAALGFYLTTYAIATIGAFAVLEHLGRPDRSLDGVDELAGLGATRPAAAAVLAVCLFSLTGIPPMAGFWGKLLIFGGALAVDPPAAGGFHWCFVGVAVLGMLNAAVAAAYYLRIVAVMYFRTPLATPRAEGGAGSWWAAVVCALALLAVGVYPGVLIHETDKIGVSPSASVHRLAAEGDGGGFRQYTSPRKEKFPGKPPPSPSAL